MKRRKVVRVLTYSGSPKWVEETLKHNVVQIERYFEDVDALIVSEIVSDVTMEVSDEPQRSPDDGT